MGRTVATPQELVGEMFTTPKELRHLAERQFDELFVPVEVMAESALSTIISLNSSALGPLVVHAERARDWYPYRITRVERAAPHPGHGQRAG